MSADYILSKSTYIRGLQCKKSLYLLKKHPHLRTPPDAVQQAKFKYGKDFERTFRDQFPHAIDVSAIGQMNFAHYPTITQSYMAGTEAVVISEAGFIHEQVLVLTDMLIRDIDGTIHIYEIKNMEKITPVVWRDAALQYFVVAHAVGGISSFNIVLRGNTQPYRIVNVTKELQKKSEGIATNILDLKSVLLEAHIPEIDMGLHCQHPYKCDFMEFCQSQKSYQEGSLF